MVNNMITKSLKIKTVNNDNSNTVLVEMTQEMYQYICHILLQKEFEIIVKQEVDKLKADEGTK